MHKHSLPLGRIEKPHVLLNRMTFTPRACAVLRRIVAVSRRL